mgnify:CR=1 FL=1|jgi:hypothetical protein
MKLGGNKPSANKFLDMMDNVGNYSEVEEDTTLTPAPAPEPEPVHYEETPATAPTYGYDEPVEVEEETVEEELQTPEPEPTPEDTQLAKLEALRANLRPPATPAPEPVEQEPEEPTLTAEEPAYEEALVSEPEPAPEAVRQETPAPTYGYEGPVEVPLTPIEPEPTEAPSTTAPLNTHTITLILKIGKAIENLPSSAVESLNIMLGNHTDTGAAGAILSIITNLEGTQSALETVKELANVDTSDAIYAGAKYYEILNEHSENSLKNLAVTFGDTTIAETTHTKTDLILSVIKNISETPSNVFEAISLITDALAE